MPLDKKTTLTYGSDLTGLDLARPIQFRFQQDFKRVDPLNWSTVGRSPCCRRDCCKPNTRAATPEPTPRLGKLDLIENEAAAVNPVRPAVWWGQVEFTLGQVRRWQLGPSTFWVERQEFEWRLHQLERAASAESEAEVARPSSVDEIDPDATLDRFAIGSGGMTLSITPQLADRPVIVRPETPLYVPSGEDITLYISSPLWLKLEVGPPTRLLVDRPTLRPSDTWFGASTLVGELCYASRTAGRLRLSELPRRPHRAVTPVRIRNQAKDPLLLERVKVPVQYLTLYRSKPGWLWTQTATLIREQDGDLAALQLGRRAPAEAVGAQRVSVPRQQAEGHLALRAFSRLFGSG